MADRGLLPDRLIRLGIRFLDKQRLAQEERSDPHEQREALDRFIAHMHASPIAVHTSEANEQHYEVPAGFFETVLGRHLKYSGCYWPEGVRNLDQAEEAMLALTCERAEITDGMTILELGCGWGSSVSVDGAALSAKPYCRRVELCVATEIYHRQGG